MVDDRPRLREMVIGGLEAATVQIGTTPERVPASVYAEEGLSWYSPSAASDAVGAFLTNDRASVSLVLGAVASGTRLVSLPIPPRTQAPQEFVARLRGILETTGVDTVVARSDVCALMAAYDIPSVAHEDLSTGAVAAPSEHGFSLVQFTSGSTGPPQGVCLSDGALGANVDAILQRVGPQDGDGAVSWLPLSHDMGLVGMLLASLSAASKGWSTGHLTIVDPTDFVRDPRIWMELVAQQSASFTAAPDFGFRQAASAGAAGLDLRSLRCIITGGDVIRADTIARFVEAMAPAGLSEGALCPAYGLAEVGLAVTLSAPGEPIVTMPVDPAKLGEGLVLHPAASAAELELVGCGPPLHGYDVTFDAPGPTEVGVIWVSGPSLGASVGPRAPLRATDGAPQLIDTGDLGFVRNGQVFVVGRHDDVIVCSGRNVSAMAVEQRLSQLDGVRPGRVCALSLPTGEWAVVAETLAVDSRSDLRRRVSAAAASVAGNRPARIYLTEKGALPMTSSGKLRRREAQAMVLRGEWS